MGKEKMLTSFCKSCCVFLCLAVVSGCAATHGKLDRRSAYEAYEAENYATAAEQFEQLVDVVPKEADLWFRLGNSYARTQRPEKAVKAYENALLRAPSMSKAWYNMGIIHLQQALKAFVDLELYGDASDPIVRRGENMREGVFRLLEEPQKPLESDE